MIAAFSNIRIVDVVRGDTFRAIWQLSKSFNSDEFFFKQYV